MFVLLCVFNIGAEMKRNQFRCLLDMYDGRPISILDTRSPFECMPVRVGSICLNGFKYVGHVVDAG